MTETALLNATFADEGAAVVAQAKAKAEEFILSVQRSVDSAIDLLPKIRLIWEGLCRIEQRGQGEAVRAVKGAFLHRLEQCLGLVRDAQIQADKAAVLGGKALARADQLPASLSALEDLRREALAGWKHLPPDPLSWAQLWMDEHADIYVGRSNVLLDTIVEEHESGASPEDIIRGYDTVRPADVYGALSYYLRYREEVELYLRRRDKEAELLKQKIEAAQPSKAERIDEIKERWSRRKAAHASPVE